jgi:uncharacterized protein
MPLLHVVLDTNVLLSGIAFPASVPGRVVAAWRSGLVSVSLSEYILDELRRVMPKLKHRHGLSDAEIADFVDLLALQADIVVPAATNDPDLTDPFDQAILGTLISAKADYLVTGDKALLRMAAKYSVLTPAEFWQRHSL